MSRIDPSESTPEHLREGQVIAGRYRVERLLGTGGMGFVVQASHISLGQRVAIKVLRKEYAKDKELLARFLREGQIAAQLPSDHIARVFDVGQTEQEEPFLVMELLTGCDLSDELEKRVRLPIEEAVDLVLRACKGVAPAHAQGLVHRDLKPANLFLQTDGTTRTMKILDFGITKVQNNDASITRTTTSYGTPQYMSPEQIKSAKHVDERTDQHALGAILFEALTGRAAFTAESLTALMVVIATEPAPLVRKFRPDCPEALEEAVLRALAKERGQRFANLGAFAMAIAPFGGPGAKQIAHDTITLLGHKLMPQPETLIEAVTSDDPRLQTNVTVTRTIRPTSARSWKTVAIALASAALAVAVVKGTAVFEGTSDVDPAPAVAPDREASGSDPIAPDEPQHPTADASGNAPPTPKIKPPANTAAASAIPSASAAPAVPANKVPTTTPPVVPNVPPTTPHVPPPPVDPGDVFGK